MLFHVYESNAFIFLRDCAELILEFFWRQQIFYVMWMLDSIRTWKTSLPLWKNTEYCPKKITTFYGTSGKACRSIVHFGKSSLWGAVKFGFYNALNLEAPIHHNNVWTIWASTFSNKNCLCAPGAAYWDILLSFSWVWSKMPHSYVASFFCNIVAALFDPLASTKHIHSMHIWLSTRNERTIINWIWISLIWMSVSSAHCIKRQSFIRLIYSKYVVKTLIPLKISNQYHNRQPLIFPCSFPFLSSEHMLYKESIVILKNSTLKF